MSRAPPWALRETLTIAITTRKLAQTIVENELNGDAKLSMTARIRRFLSRFLAVVIVSLAIECLVAAFQYVHNDPSVIIRASLIAFGASALWVSWRLFRLTKKSPWLQPRDCGFVKPAEKLNPELPTVF